jgi:hypothetical protein
MGKRRCLHSKWPNKPSKNLRGLLVSEGGSRLPPYLSAGGFLGLERNSGFRAVSARGTLI